MQESRELVVNGICLLPGVRIFVYSNKIYIKFTRKSHFHAVSI